MNQMLELGQNFPEFNLIDGEGNFHSSESIKGQYSVIYFYPKDDTSGCTVEACGFRDRLSDIEGAKVFGVSPDDQKSHKKFADKFNLTFPLLVDQDHKLAEACGIWVEKSMYGKKYMGIERTTFLVGPQGQIVEIWRKVKPEGHAEEVKERLSEITSNVTR